MPYGAALSPGQTSQVVQIGDSFYILYCESKKDSGEGKPRDVAGEQSVFSEIGQGGEVLCIVA